MSTFTKTEQQYFSGAKDKVHFMTEAARPFNIGDKVSNKGNGLEGEVRRLYPDNYVGVQLKGQGYLLAPEADFDKC